MRNRSCCKLFGYKYSRGEVSQKCKLAVESTGWNFYDFAPQTLGCRVEYDKISASDRHIVAESMIGVACKIEKAIADERKKLADGSTLYKVIETPLDPLHPWMGQRSDKRKMTREEREEILNLLLRKFKMTLDVADLFGASSVAKAMARKHEIVLNSMNHEQMGIRN